MERCGLEKTSALRQGGSPSPLSPLLIIKINIIIMMIRVAVKMEVKNKRRKELPLSKEVEMLTMLHEGGHHADADDSHCTIG